MTIRLMCRLAFHLVILLCVACTGCSEKSPLTLSDNGHSDAIRSKSEKPKDLLQVNSIYVVPPLIDKSVVSSAPDEKRMYQVVKDVVTAELTIEAHYLDASRKDSPKGDTFKVARAFGADAALVTTIKKYSDRIGSQIGASQAASVAFDLDLIRVSDGKTVWQATYSFTDTSLTENLLAFNENVAAKGGNGGWTSANQLLARGLHEGLRDFNDKRTAQFMTNAAR